MLRMSELLKTLKRRTKLSLTSIKLSKIKKNDYFENVFENSSNS